MTTRPSRPGAHAAPFLPVERAVRLGPGKTARYGPDQAPETEGNLMYAELRLEDRYGVSWQVFPASEMNVMLSDNKTPTS